MPPVDESDESVEFLPSCVRPNRRFSCANRLWLSWSDMNFVSLLCWIWLWSSSRPCWRPNKPPTKFGRKSSILLWIISFCWLHELVEKFNWRLKIAGNMLNCCESGDVGLRPKWDEVPLLLLSTPPVPPAAVQFCLKSNLLLFKLSLIPMSLLLNDNE